MISSNELQSAYIKLYALLREYIWDFETARQIAKLEVAIYDRFPNLRNIRRILDTLRSDTRSVEAEDEKLKSAMNNLYSVLAESDSVYAKLDSVKEVIQNENN